MNSVQKPVNSPFLSISQWQVIATALCFFALGFSTAAWAPLVPILQHELHISHSHFGLLLFGGGIASMFAMTIAGRLAHQLGCRMVLAVVLIAFMFILPLLASSQSLWMLALGLMCFGASAGALGVAVNMQAVLVETAQSKSYMSMFHGICSLGGLSGVLLMTTLLSFGLSALSSAVVISVIIAAILMVAFPFCCLNTQQSAQETTPAAKNQHKPNFAIICIGLVCFIAFLSEGAAMDWSGIYLREQFHVLAQQSGLAYSCFAALMVAGRLSGRWIIARLGEKNTLFYSAVCAAIGMMTVVFAPISSVALIGYAIVGLGSANIVPLMFSRAGHQQEIPQHQALSYVSIFAYTGSLMGPAFVGFSSDAIGLEHTFFIIAVGLVLIPVLNQLSTPSMAIFDRETPV